MPKSKRRHKKHDERAAKGSPFKSRDDYEAGRRAAERNIARGVTPGSSLESMVDLTAPRTNPLGLDLSDSGTLPQRRVPDPKVSVGGREITGEAKARALGDVFGEGAAALSRENQGLRMTPREKALDIARAAQTEKMISWDKTLVVLMTGDRAEGFQSREELSDALIDIARNDLDTHAETFQQLSSAMLMGLQQDGAPIPDQWVTASLDREQRDVHRELTRVSAEAADTMAAQRRLNLDTELLTLVRQQGDDPADPRLALLSETTRQQAESYGITIKPDVVSLLTEDIRERLLHVMLGKDDRFEPIPGKPTSLRLNPARGIATGDLRKAQMHAIEQGAPATQCIDPRLDTLLDDGGTHFLLMTDLLDDSFATQRGQMKDGDPARPFMAAAVRCRIWAKTAFSGPNQAITTEVTLPLQDFMLAPSVAQILPAAHPAYGRNGQRVLDLAKDEKIPYFEMSMEELSGATSATPEYPEVQQGGHRLQTAYSDPNDVPLAMPREVFDALPEESKKSLLESSPDLRILG